VKAVPIPAAIPVAVAKIKSADIAVVVAG